MAVSYTRTSDWYLARMAFARSSHYDVAIANYFDNAEVARRESDNVWPSPLEPSRSNDARRSGTARTPTRRPRSTLSRIRASPLRRHGRATSRQGAELQQHPRPRLGPEPRPRVRRAGGVVVKHNNPCGAATAATLADAFRAAWDGDPQSAFGGILAFNRPVDADTAAALMDPKAKRFIECVIAPDYDPAALDALKKWKENVRLLRTGELVGGPQGLDYRRVDGGLLVQTRDVGADDPDKWKVVDEAAADRRRVGRRCGSPGSCASTSRATRSCWRTGAHGRRRRGRADEPGRFGRRSPSARPASG